MYLTAFRNGKISDLITKKAFIISNLIADGQQDFGRRPPDPGRKEEKM